jgi:hypothetical protein
MSEEWKDIAGYEGLYQVSNLGKIKRLFKNGKEHALIGKKDKDGYIVVSLSKNQKKKYCRLHRVVADAFLSNPDGKPQINHKDRNKQNNTVANLEWVTASENTVHCFATGRDVFKRPVLQYDKNMVLVACWNSIKEASRKTGVDISNLCACCRGRLKSSGGYVWRYKGVNWQ